MTQQEQFKQAMSRFATGVCVMTFENPQNGEADGVTISAFSSLSLEPLKVLFCLGNWGQAKDNFQQVQRFAVNILSSEQKDLAYQFAGHDREGLSQHLTWIDGLPVLKNTLANVVCDKGNHYTEGDHDIIIGNVQEIVLSETPLQPLLYFQSKIIEDYHYE